MLAKKRVNLRILEFKGEMFNNFNLPEDVFA
jgi:hypothetical protein